MLSREGLRGDGNPAAGRRGALTTLAGFPIPLLQNQTARGRESCIRSARGANDLSRIPDPLSLRVALYSGRGRRGALTTMPEYKDHLLQTGTRAGNGGRPKCPTCAFVFMVGCAISVTSFIRHPSSGRAARPIRHVQKKADDGRRNRVWSLTTLVSGCLRSFAPNFTVGVSPTGCVVGLLSKFSLKYFPT
jgi:hypothetical protein